VVRVVCLAGWVRGSVADGEDFDPVGGEGGDVAWGGGVAAEDEEVVLRSADELRGEG
jgi:hypothetical protein